MTAVAQATFSRSGPGESAAQVARIVWSGRIVLTLAVLAIWQYQSSKDAFWASVISTPIEVLQRLGLWLVTLKWWGDLFITLEEAALGYLLGLAVALILVAILTPSPLLGRFAAPFIAASNALPKVALA